jgi:hypothetical protein
MWFTLAICSDYSAQAAAKWKQLRQSDYPIIPSNNTGKHVGEELDVVATYTFNPNFNVQVGYLYFWYGPMVENNSPRGNAGQLYVQTTFSY